MIEALINRTQGFTLKRVDFIGSNGNTFAPITSHRTSKIRTDISSPLGSEHSAILELAEQEARKRGININDPVTTADGFGVKEEDINNGEQQP